MKKSMIITVFLFISLLSNGQSIGDVQRRDDGYTKVFDVNNKQIATGYTGGSNDDFGFSNCIVVVRRDDGYTKIYDENLKSISSGYAGGSGDTFNVVGCNIVCKRKDGYKKTYDRNLKQLSSGY